MKRFKIKTEILFGEGALDYLKELKNKKVFIVTDPFMVKSGTIEKLTNNLTSSEVFVFSEIVPDPPIELVVSGIESFATSSGYSLLLTYTKDDPICEKECMNELLMRNVSGIINISPNTERVDSSFFDQMASRIPLVFINSYIKRPAISYVYNDERIGTKIALEHLVSLGHQNICFVRGERSDSYEFKEDVYIEFMKKMGCYNPENIINVSAGNSIDTVELTAKKIVEFLPNRKDVTALFCCNDLMGVGAVNACRRLNLKIPEDISIMGYDNVSLSHFIEPKLTTMDQNMMTLGWTAASLLMEKIASDNKTSRQVVLQNTLVLRDTTGPCKTNK